MTTPGPQSHLRIARPTRDLAAAERFWADGLGLEVLYRVIEGHRLLMLGWPDAAWHLELIKDDDVTPRPTEEDLLVLYLGQPAADELLTRLQSSGAAGCSDPVRHGPTAGAPSVEGYRRSPA